MREINNGNRRIAKYWYKDKQKNAVVCKLSPRNCVIKDGQMGFCGVRGNVIGELNTFNYGVGVEATIETIETEAVYHFYPGTRILSLGNVGCMMSCKFCQNWTTSQVKHLNKNNLRFYTPEEIIDMAVENNIGVISWTYNDPVVWHEFVMDTSKLAKSAGIKVLYKTALYIEPEPLAELIEVVDIFSVSLKSMNPDMYRKFTKGRLDPVLRGILQIAKSNCHLEISQLIVTGLNDSKEDARKSARWIVENIGDHIPLHFVGYHPAYKYNKPRTPLSALLSARDIAKSEGIKYCYLGNVYRDDVSNTYCDKCGSLLVQRFGLTVKNAGLSEDNKCLKCGENSPINGIEFKSQSGLKPEGILFNDEKSFEWSSEENSLHIIQQRGDIIYIKVERGGGIEYYELNKGIERLILSKSGKEEKFIKIYTENIDDIAIVPVLDRAHYPVLNDSIDKSKYIN